jgi:GNAT superfamily N-acetyltransferase
MHETRAWRIEHRLPTVEEHRRLAESVGWADGFHWPSLPGSLENSLYGVVATSGDEIVGMGRIVGDGSMYFYIQDVAVSPRFQRMGIGQAIVEALLAWVEARSPAVVGLFATPEAGELYRRHGFSDRDMTGMMRVVRPHDDRSADGFLSNPSEPDGNTAPV